MRRLNYRERKVARLLRDGIRTNEIARRLKMTRPTVIGLRRRMYKVLGVRDQLELILMLTLPLDSPWRNRATPE